MMSGGNGYDVSDFSAGSKWLWNWITETSVVHMQPEGATPECPSCKSAGAFSLKPFDDKDVPPSPDTLMGIHIPISNTGGKLYSYWLSYRSGNPAKKGLSIHLVKYSFRGPFAATYDSWNYDAFGDTNDLSDSFVVENTCYYVAPSGFMKDVDVTQVSKLHPVICVGAIDVGISVAVTVFFIDLQSPPPARPGTTETILDCNTITSVLELNANNHNLVRVQNTGADGSVVVKMCSGSSAADQSSSAFLSDE